ncbi:uncharacterized protein LOC116344399 [Contarinia nasturtii]|uniref:uncharacterized protein LOC116344399 n=1 Tax=Contarinia nasturtii TaxID=265458 RepID=UPI0012D41E11|nr:uncharacterized protein LOC116344399 [Contarinia nasturtii]
MKLIFLLFTFVPLFVAIENEIYFGKLLESDLPKFCFHASILLEEGDTRCNGAIISSTQILTSFKCVRYWDYHTRYESKNISVRVGSIERFNGGIVRQVASFKHLPYPLNDHIAESDWYKESTRIEFEDLAKLDLIVFTLKDPLPLGPTICPIRLAEKEDDIYVKIGTSVEIVGCSTLKRETIETRELHSIKETISNVTEKCPQFFFPRTGIYKEEGAPLIVRRKNNLFPKGEPLLLGIVSDGDSFYFSYNGVVKISAFSGYIMGNKTMPDGRC